MFAMQGVGMADGRGKRPGAKPASLPSAEATIMRTAVRKKPILLHMASGSPRRRELMALTGWRVQVSPVEVDELAAPGEHGAAYARRLARAKLQAAKAGHPEAELLLAADTVVVDGSRLLGKPANRAEALQMLMSLSGRGHRVVTALALWGRAVEVSEICETSVRMRAYDGQTAAAYLATGSPMDKAGAYGIQDRGLDLVDVPRLKGCFANVMGLPLCHLVRALRFFREVPPEEVPDACRRHTGYHCPVYASILGEAG